MIECYRPEPEDLWFREALLADAETMAYNRAWGGTIPFPESRWRDWYEIWVADCGDRHFYRYLRDAETGRFVGEIAYHFEAERELWLANVIVAASLRGRGYGTAGLRLLCEAAAARGVACLCDDIAADNPGIALFRKEGFAEVSRSEKCILLKKELGRGSDER